MSKPAFSLAKEPRRSAEIKRQQGVYQVASITLEVKTDERVQLKNLTAELVEFVARAGVSEGVLHVSSLHTTAGFILNETQDALLADVHALFEQIAPQGVYYRHNDSALSDCTRKNADAHLRALVVGHSLTIPVESGQLKLGQWQQVLFSEFDGPNQRKVHLQVMGI